MDNENEKTNLKTSSLSILPRLSFTPDFLYLLPFSSAGEIRMEFWIQSIKCCLSCSFLLRGRTPCSLSLIHYGIPTVSHISSWTAPVLVPCTGCSSLGTGCFSVGSFPYGVINPASQPASVWSPLSLTSLFPSDGTRRFRLSSLYSANLLISHVTL